MAAPVALPEGALSKAEDVTRARATARAEAVLGNLGARRITAEEHRLPPLEGVGPTHGELRLWARLVSLRPPPAVQQRLAPAAIRTHAIEKAWGPVSLDRYEVRVTRLPAGVGDGTPEALLEEMRLRLSPDVILPQEATFAAFDGFESAWASDSPLGAVVHIDMGGRLNPDDGAVICSSRTPREWVFSTAAAPGDFTHPVSGNRAFGVERRPGGPVFYTQGADRTTGILDHLSETVLSTHFRAAAKLWRHWQHRFAAWVEGLGGAAEVIDPPMWALYDWEVVRRAYWSPKVPWVVPTAR